MKGVISVNGALYERLKAYCDQHGTTMSQVVTALIESVVVEPADPELVERVEMASHVARRRPQLARKAKALAAMRGGS